VGFFFFIRSNIVLSFLCLTYSGCCWIKMLLLFVSESAVVFSSVKNL